MERGKEVDGKIVDGFFFLFYAARNLKYKTYLYKSLSPRMPTKIRRRDCKRVVGCPADPGPPFLLGCGPRQTWVRGAFLFCGRIRSCLSRVFVIVHGMARGRAQFHSWVNHPRKGPISSRPSVTEVKFGFGPQCPVYPVHHTPATLLRALVPRVLFIDATVISQLPVVLCITRDILV